ncbi:hypothetical protein [Streptosporangium saharense]|uniref:hypothetical protein n=1 Tax=Streptosporangium saharense TaxID=1706840 RepID=UPI003436B263
MPDTPLPPKAQAPPTWPCSSKDCPHPAAYTITFRNQPGHVHDCISHTADLREWTDVTKIVELPCPYTHGSSWTDTPRPLGEQPEPDAPDAAVHPA